MLATCDDSLEGLRDRALLCFGFASGGRRRSDIAAADMRDLRNVGDDGYIYRLEYSKTQQAGVKADSTPDKPILGRSAEALEAWLKAADIREGAIFRRVWKDRLGPPLLPGSVASTVKRRAHLAGLEGDFCAHSLPASGDGHDRAPFCGERNWVLSIRSCGRKSCCKTAQVKNYAASDLLNLRETDHGLSGKAMGFQIFHTCQMIAKAVLEAVSESKLCDLSSRDEAPCRPDGKRIAVIPEELR